ncbi:VOC family protein [Chryseobacterium indoltheticum]|jgi:catechol 2,3-dioxygenase-like lactoylglutathione lyase family enzyme|uniref:VOC family protein n=1 Tax=Chryseobacterium indoltheticum TaxID=254 RepID=UPI00242E0C23|nr:VOC family protein [Chryseobacterium indoltheticum]MDF2832261.1 family N-acetyltransferase [Chryseobacterium indoltheticum]
MNQKIKSIRPFIGAKDFAVSRAFYRDLGFEEVEIDPKFSVFKKGDFAFYLQDYYSKEWIENTMIFLEIENVDLYWEELVSLNLKEKYNSTRLVPTKTEVWGKECFLLDPAGVLWHFGEFFTT